MVFVLKLAPVLSLKMIVWSRNYPIVVILLWHYDENVLASQFWQMKALLNNRQNFLLYSKNFESY